VTERVKGRRVRRSQIGNAEHSQESKRKSHKVDGMQRGRSSRMKKGNEVRRSENRFEGERRGRIFFQRSNRIRKLRGIKNVNRK
jgi:hypothetical protein